MTKKVHLHICIFGLILIISSPVSANELVLDVEEVSLYVQPGENVITDMDVRNLLQKVLGCQAVLGYSSMYLQAGAGCVVPGGAPWDELIYNSWDIPGVGVSGEIDTAIGIDANSTTTGTDADNTIAIITLTALTEGTTQIVFRPDVDDIECTWLADMDAQPVWPTKYNSQTIVIDGTDPVVTVIYPNGGEILKGGDSCAITWTATDAYIDYDSVKIEYYNGSVWVEIASGEDNDGTYDWSVPSLDINNARVKVTVWDLAGNSGSDESDADFIIDSTDPVVVDIKATQFGGPDLTPSGSGNAVPGTVDIAVTTSDNLSGVAGPPTVTVTPNGGSAEPATFVSELPAGTFNYTWEVSSTPLNGPATITVSSLTDNAGNVAADVTDTFDIYYVTGTIGDFVWNDMNRDGIQDTGEPGIGDVNVLLKNDLGVTIDTKITDASGFYHFTDLCSGTYTVVVDENTLPAYFVASPCNQGSDDTKDNDCSPVDVTLPDDFTSDLTIDFGYNLPPCEMNVTKVGCVLVPRQDCKGKVIRMTLQYTGQGCDAGSHNQVGDKVSCTGDPNGAEPVDIVVSNKKGSRVWAYATDVSVGDLIFADAANAGKDELESETMVKVFDAGGALLQEIKFYTSCSQPLNVGDQFGSMLLVSLTTTEGGEVTLPEDPNDVPCITELPPTEGSGCDGVKICVLRLRYTGGGCAASSHNQSPDKVSCWDNGQDSPSPARIVAIDKRGEVWLDSNVEFGDIVELAAARNGKSEILSVTTIYTFDVNDELVEEVTFHTSCSEPLNVGDQFGSVQIFGMQMTDGRIIALGYDVEYTYTITNIGPVPVMNVMVVDDVLGEVPGSPIPLIMPGDGNSVTLTLTALVSEATTNCVVVTGNVLESDFNVDGIVDFRDFAHFSAHWPDNNCASPDWCDRADLDMNGTVDTFDLAILCDQWLLESTPCETTACATITKAQSP